MEELTQGQAAKLVCDEQNIDKSIEEMEYLEERLNERLRAVGGTLMH